MRANCATYPPCLLARGLGHPPEPLEEWECPSLGEVLVYDHFANLTAKTDLSPRFAFQSLELDDSVPLFAAQVRCYDPRPGQWMQKDPVGFAASDANLFRFVSDQHGSFINEDGTIRDA